MLVMGGSMRSMVARGVLPLAAFGVLLAGCAGTTPSQTPTSGPTQTPADDRSESATATATAQERLATATPTTDGDTSTRDHTPIRVRTLVDAASPISSDGSDGTTAMAGEPFILDGARSTDDGVVQTFTWTQVGGPYAFISDFGSPAPSVVPSQPGTYVFELAVSDSSGTSHERVEVTVERNVFKQEFGPVQANRAAFAAGGTIPIAFALLDSSADLVSVDVQFSVDGGATWRDATRVGTDRPEEATSSVEEATSLHSSATVGRAANSSIPTPTPTPERHPDAVLVGIEQTPSTDEPDSGDRDSTSSSSSRHTFVWDAQADLGSTAQEVLVRGWDPVKKQPIQGTTRVYYNPVISDATSACSLHPDLWRLDPDTTAVRNRQLDACALRLAGELAKDGAVSRDEALAVSEAIHDYSTAPADHLGAEADLLRAYDSLDRQMQNIDLQNALQRQQQILQMMSNIMKARHDTAMNAIRNMKA